MDGKKVTAIVAFIALFIVVIGEMLGPTQNKLSKITRDTVMNSGKADTTSIWGKPDSIVTVHVRDYTAKLVDTTQKDSIKSTFKEGLNSVLVKDFNGFKITVKTYPRVDSAFISAIVNDSVLRIKQTDTIKITRVDTAVINVFKEEFEEVPFYKNNWFYATLGTVAILITLIFTK